MVIRISFSVGLRQQRTVPHLYATGCHGTEPLCSAVVLLPSMLEEDVVKSIKGESLNR